MAPNPHTPKHNSIIPSSVVGTLAEPMDLLYLAQGSLTAPLDTSDALLSKLETAGKVPSKDKFRCMVCWTMVCSGSCPYNDRCVFLHDPRIKINGIRLKPFKLTKSTQTAKDTLYWPDMQRTAIHRNLDRQGLPDANQMYIIPDTFATSQPKLSLVPLSSKRSYFHDRAVYSLWTHFVDFCVREHPTGVAYPNAAHVNDATQNTPRNAFIPSMKRLKVFVELAGTASDSISLRNTPDLLPGHAPSKPSHNISAVAPTSVVSASKPQHMGGPASKASPDTALTALLEHEAITGRAQSSRRLSRSDSLMSEIFPSTLEQQPQQWQHVAKSNLKDDVGSLLDFQQQVPRKYCVSAECDPMFSDGKAAAFHPPPPPPPVAPASFTGHNLQQQHQKHHYQPQQQLGLPVHTTLSREGSDENLFSLVSETLRESQAHQQSQQHSHSQASWLPQQQQQLFPQPPPPPPAQQALSGYQHGTNNNIDFEGFLPAAGYHHLPPPPPPPRLPHPQQPQQFHRGGAVPASSTPAMGPFGLYLDDFFFNRK